MQSCPKCGYTRTALDRNPEWQCPSCHIAYAKFNPAAAPARERLAAEGREMVAEARADHSAYALIATNVVALAIAWATGMTTRELMLVYLIQSVIIGATSAIRIARLERFDPGGVRVNGRQLEETPAAKKRLAAFFAFHYGFFHLIYFVFVAGPRPGDEGDAFGPAWPYLLCALAFALNHGYSLARNLRHDAAGRPKIGTIMMLPYARILPMHVVILVGGTIFPGPATFLLFGILKTGADVLMHVVEHHVLHKAGSRA